MYSRGVMSAMKKKPGAGCHPGCRGHKDHETLWANIPARGYTAGAAALGTETILHKGALVHSPWSRVWGELDSDQVQCTTGCGKTEGHRVGICWNGGWGRGQRTLLSV